MAELAVVLVTWNVRDLVLDALRSLYADLDAFGPEAQIYVVDNASADGTPEAVVSAFPAVHLIANPVNQGFAAANNTALREIGFGRLPADQLPRAVYLLNPDTLVQPGSTRKLFDTLLGDTQTGLVGAQLAYGDGSFQHGAFCFPGLRQLWVEFFPTPGRLYESSFNGRYPRQMYAAEQPFDIDFPLGATMMLRREVIEQTAGFDEQFFMYCEEIDWAWRIHNEGWKVRCVPAARVIHLEGRSTGQVRPQSVVNLWRSRLRLYQKHYPFWKFWLARQMVVLGMQRKLHQLQDNAQLDEDQRMLLRDAFLQVQQMARTGQGV
jgi:GT2 family glycosyltransferase